MRYEFKTADGRSCCKSDDPKLLCAACRARLAAANSSDAPDGYKAALAAGGRTPYTSSDPTDGYAAALKGGRQ